MISLLLKEKRILYFKFMKNYMLVLIMFILAFIMASYFGDMIISEMKFTIDIIYILIGLIILGGLYVFKKHPSIYIEYPLLHHIYESKYFNQVLYFKYLVTFIKSLVLGFAVYGIIISIPFIVGDIDVSLLNTLLLFFNIYFLSWINYNNSVNKLYILILYLAASASLFFNNAYSLVSLLIITLITCLLTIKVNIYFEKFFKDCKFLYTSSAVASSNDYERMIQFSGAYSAVKNYRIKFSSFNTHGIKSIIVRNFLHLIRQNKPSIVIITVLAFISLILSSDYTIFKFFICIYINNYIINLSTSSIESLINKIKSGLLIPFSSKEILKANMVVPICFIFIFSIILSLNFGILQGIILLILLELIIIGCVFFIIRYPNKNKLIKLTSTLLSAISIALIYFL